MKITHLVWGALLTTVFVLATVFVLNRFTVTRGIVQSALVG